MKQVTQLLEALTESARFHLWAIRGKLGRGGLDDPEHWQRDRLSAARRNLACFMCRLDRGVVTAAQTVIYWG